jgi:protein-disulfide isomerase
MDTNQHPDQEALMAWQDGEITGAEAAAIRAHVDACTGCASIANEFGVVSARLGAWQVESAAFGAPRMGSGPRLFRWAAAACLAVAAISLPAWWWTTGRHSGNRTSGLSANILLPGAAQAAGLSQAGQAKVTLTVFVDWQCPACAVSYPTYFELMKEYEKSAPGQVALVIKDFPVNAKCNAAVKTNLHPGACEAAAAVRMARARGRGDAMIRFLIGHVRPPLQPEEIRSATTEIAGPLDFDAAYARELAGIQKDVSEAVVRHVQFTPSFFLNDIPLSSNGYGFPTTAELREAIDAQLRAM